MFTRMKTRFLTFLKELKLQASILWKGGKRELKIYRLERDERYNIWAPSKGRWVRASAYHWGFKYVRIRFVDGAEKTGKRSPLSIRPRDPRKMGADMPLEDARYSGSGMFRLPIPELSIMEAVAHQSN